MSISVAAPDDSAAVGRLVGLDAGTAEGIRVAQVIARDERPGVLVAEVGGSVVAALELDSGRAFGDPFRHTRAAIAQLREHARRVEAPRGRERRLGAGLLRPQPRRAWQ